MIRPLVTLNKMTCAIRPPLRPFATRDRNSAKQPGKRFAASASALEHDRFAARAKDHVGCTILQPVSATEPAASSPDTKVATVNTSSAPDFGGWALPTKMFGINS